MGVKQGYNLVAYYYLDTDNMYIKESRWTRAESVEVSTGVTLDAKLEDMETYLITTDERTILSKLSVNSSGKLMYNGNEVGYTVPNVIEEIYVNGAKLVPAGYNKAVNVTVPTKLSELSNDNYTVIDADYYTLKSKLNGIENNAQVNKIESITINNGTAQTITNKKVNISVPTKTSELTNDSNFVVDNSYKHTDNNFTTAYKNKLESITVNPDGTTAVVNIENISVNGAIQSINNKTVDITVPTKLSQLTNDDNTVKDSTYSALKTKINGIESNAQINKLESIKVNGTAKTISNKAVDITYADVVTDSNFETSNITWTTSYVVNDNTIDAGGTSATLADSAFETTDLTFSASDFA